METHNVLSIPGMKWLTVNKSPKPITQSNICKYNLKNNIRKKTTLEAFLTPTLESDFFLVELQDTKHVNRPSMGNIRKYSGRFVDTE